MATPLSSQDSARSAGDAGVGARAVMILAWDRVLAGLLAVVIAALWLSGGRTTLWKQIPAMAKTLWGFSELIAGGAGLPRIGGNYMVWYAVGTGLYLGALPLAMMAGLSGCGFRWMPRGMGFWIVFTVHAFLLAGCSLTWESPLGAISLSRMLTGTNWKLWTLVSVELSAACLWVAGSCAERWTGRKIGILVGISSETAED